MTPSEEAIEAEIQEKGLTAPRLTPAADAILHTDIPVIAAVNGAAVGWGMELALMADIRIASEKAKFGELFVLRGLCTDVCGIGRLAQVVGREVLLEGVLRQGKVLAVHQKILRSSSSSMLSSCARSRIARPGGTSSVFASISRARVVLCRFT